MLYDISPPMRPGMPTWPGDTPFSEMPVWQLGKRCPVNVAALQLSPHAGAHADAPLHYQAGGQAIGEVELSPYLGRCRVIHCLDAGDELSLAHLQAAVQRLDTPLPERILLRTYRLFPLDTWDADFCAISAAAIDWLGARGVRLIGVDAASLDPPGSKTMDAHRAVARQGMAILENLLLDAVPEGDYELIALPLKLINLDASPVRAVLRTFT